MGGIHTYVVFCMFYNPMLCIDYEIVPSNFDPVGSIAYCMKGGALFSMDNATMTIGGIDYVSKGVHCKGNPPDNSDIDAWVAAQKEKLHRLEPQVK